MIRFPESSFSRDALLHQCQDLTTRTKYVYSAKNEDAPRQTNCVTAIRYLFERSSKHSFPPVWIGDMPRKLLNYGASLHTATISTIKMGDLLFLRKNANHQTEKTKRYIVHVMLVIDTRRIFHSSEKRKGGFTENLSQPMDDYLQKIPMRIINEPYLFLRYIDPRNEKLRTLYDAEYFPFPIYRPLSCGNLLLKKWILIRDQTKKLTLISDPPKTLGRSGSDLQDAREFQFRF